MGRVAGAYGVRGWVKAAPLPGVQGELAQVHEWRLGARSYRVVQARAHGAAVVAKLEGVESREQARALKGSEISVARAALPEPGDGRYYLADLLGLNVVNVQGVTLGEVRRWLSNGLQDVMEVAGEQVRLIPWVAAVVKSVDLEAGRIEVDWGADW